MKSISGNSNPLSRPWARNCVAGAALVTGIALVIIGSLQLKNLFGNPKLGMRFLPIGSALVVISVIGICYLQRTIDPPKPNPPIRDREQAYIGCNEGVRNFHSAAREGNYGKISRILDENPALINLPDRDHCTALYHAALTGRPLVVMDLMERGADPNVRDREGFTPLSCHTADPQITGLLLDKGAKIDRTESGYTALHFAAMNGHLETLKIILKKYPDSIRDGIGRGADFKSTLSLAVEKNQQAVVNELLKFGAFVLPRDIDAARDPSMKQLLQDAFSKQSQS